MLIEKCHNKAIMQSAMNQSNQSDCLIPANISVFHTKKNKKQTLQKILVFILPLLLS